MALKQKLINSMTPLVYLNPSRIHMIQDALKEVKIPENHYKQVVTLILLIVKDIPEILDSPNISKLTLLCQDCADHIAKLEDARPKKSFNNRN